MSPYLVKAGSFVRIPGHGSCFYECRCEINGYLSDCRQVCQQLNKNCIVNEKNVTHLAQVMVNSNECLCVNGILQCGKRFVSFLYNSNTIQIDVDVFKLWKKLISKKVNFAGKNEINLNESLMILES